MTRAFRTAALACALALVCTAVNAKPRHKIARTDSQNLSQCVSDNNGRTVCGGSIQRSGGLSKAPVQYEGIGQASSSLVAEARKYIGTNPTGRRSLWCGAFMDLVLKNTGHKGGGNLASAYARYGTRVSGPQVGAIAVMSRSGGGHVGVVSGVDPNGNPIIISGNTRMGKGPHTTLEHAYPSGRIYAYVMPR